MDAEGPNKEVTDIENTDLMTDEIFLETPTQIETPTNSDINFVDYEGEILTSTSTSSSSFLSGQYQSSGKTAKKRESDTLHRYVDQVSKEDIQLLTSDIPNLFFGCNILFSVVESDNFRKLMTDARPAFRAHLPGRKTFATTLLDKKYEECIRTSKEVVGKSSVLLIDGWKNSSSNSRIVVTMLHSCRNAHAFLEAWDITGELETGDKLTEIVNSSIQKADEIHGSQIYAVVSDNAANMMKMGRNIPIWHSTCNSHTANLLAKDLTEQVLIKQVNLILKEFKQPDLERALKEKGGLHVTLACETRWASHRDACKCLVKNVQNLRLLIIEGNILRKIKPEVKNFIFDDDFFENVRRQIELFEFIQQGTSSNKSASFRLYCD